jgi:hypothetical protein
LSRVLGSRLFFLISLISAVSLQSLAASDSCIEAFSQPIPAIVLALLHFFLQKQTEKPYSPSSLALFSFGLEFPWLSWSAGATLLCRINLQPPPTASLQPTSNNPTYINDIPR